MSLTFGAVNRFLMLDISGPYHVKPRLNSRATRSNTGKIKVYMLHSVCLTSYITCITAIEDYGSEAFIDGLHRIGTRYGYPTVAWTDGSHAQLKGLIRGKYTLNSLLGDIYEETGIEVRVSGAGPSSHSRNGRVEKSIDCFKRYVANKKVDIENLTILQLETMASQASAFLNSMPLAHKKRIGSSVSSALISPFSFLLGRQSNCRAPAGYPKLPNSRGHIIDAVEKATAGMFNIFMAQIPDLLLRPAKHQGEKTQLKIGDLIIFPYEESPIAKQYRLGLITDLELDSDDLPRIVEVAYCLSNEQKLPIDPTDKNIPKTRKRFTRRGIHTICKIYSVDDPDINKDITRINASLNINEHPPMGKETNIDESSADHQPALSNPLTPGINPTLLMMQLGYLVYEHHGNNPNNNLI